MKPLERWLVIAAILACLSPAAGAASIMVVEGFVPTNPLNFPFEAGFYVSGLGNGVSPALAEYDITLTYDPAILSPSFVTFENALGNPNNPAQTLTSNQFLTLGSGMAGVELIEVSLLDPSTLRTTQGASSFGGPGFFLGGVVFNPLSIGTSSLNIIVGSAKDENGNLLVLETINGNITITPPGAAVPEPASFLLGATGLIALTLCRKLHGIWPATRQDARTPPARWWSSSPRSR